MSRKIENFLIQMMRIPCWGLVVCVSLCGWSQEGPNPLESEIEAFESADIADGHRSDFILFTGSSSIRLWKNLEEDMAGHQVLNRGFGGAKLSDLNFYWGRILAEHRPELVVVYCGENDIWDGVGVDQTFQEFKSFQRKFRRDLKGVPLIYIAMKPSINRWEKWEDYRAADRKIKRAIWWKRKQKFVDLGPTMLLEDGTPDQDIFISDMLHMNAKGYRGWTNVLLPIIQQTLDK